MEETKKMKDEPLLVRLGGVEMLKRAVDVFYERITNDAELQPFFIGVNIKLLKWHQYNFMSIAFASVEHDMDLQELILVKHKRLFGMGLQADQFDLFLEHFVITLQELGVEESVIEEATSQHLIPLRSVFVQAALDARQEKRKKRLIRTAAAASAVALLVAFYFLPKQKTSSSQK